MKVWVYLDGRQQGPFEFDELFNLPVTPSTKVWFEGLPKWCAAGDLTEMSPLFQGRQTAEAAEPAVISEQSEHSEPLENSEPVEAASEAPQAPASRWAPGQRSYGGAKRPDEPCPPTHLAWSVILMVCCCSPVSLAALVASICTSTYYNNGNMDKARRASEISEWLIMIAIALGFIPVVLMSAIFGA